LYNHIGRNPEALDVADGAYRIIQRCIPKGSLEFFPKQLNRDGTPASGPDKDIYGDMCVAEGLVEFSRATGDLGHWHAAKEIVLKCIYNYDQPDYNPEIGQTYLGPGAKLFPGARVQGHWLVLIRVVSQMLETRADADLQQVLDRSIDALLNHHYNPRYQLISELLNHDLSRPSNEYEQFVYAAHAIEVTWMIMYEARRTGNRSLFRRDKTLFPHQEAINGAMCLIESSGDPWATEFFLDLNQYMHEKFSMKSLNSPLWQVAGDRWVTSDPAMSRAENYHQPRFLMLSLLAIERLIKAQGNSACTDSTTSV
jgi:hypothetical protein